MRIYLAGPMRSKPYYNFPEFDRVAEILRANGHEVVNPADLDRESGFDAMALHVATDWDAILDYFDLRACISRDLNALLSCEAVVVLRGWKESTGARTEVAVAEWAGMKIYSQELGENI